MSKKGKRIAPNEGAIKKGRLLNAMESPDRQDDWVAEETTSAAPLELDLRDTVPSPWGRPNDQGRTGSCVGQAVAKVLHWHLLNEGVVERPHKRYSPSVRFLWQAPKEFDQWIYYPTTMLQASGTYIKTSVDILRKHGCPTDRDLPMNSPGSMLPPKQFLKRCEKFQIKEYRAVTPYETGFHLEGMRTWISKHGPVVTRLDVDRDFMKANRKTKMLELGSEGHAYGGHAVVVVGYKPEGLLLLNSWGKKWGNNGLIWVSNDWAKFKLTESYGIIL